LSLPAASARTSITPEALTDPAGTSSPGPASTGTDSPVIAEVSRLVRPETTTPSVAILSPARTSSTSSTRMSLAASSTTSSPRLIRAVSGTSRSSARRPERARSIARSSRASAMEYRKARAAASSTLPSRTAPTALIVMSRPMPSRPRVTSATTAPGAKVAPPASSPIQNSIWETPSAPMRWQARPARKATVETSGSRISRSRHQGVPVISCVGVSSSASAPDPVWQQAH
jgi:hypothetical protein